MKKSISINGRFLNRRMTGVDRFAHEIVMAIDRLRMSNDCLGTDFDIEILVPSSYQGNSPYNTIPLRRVGFFSGSLWEQFDIYFYCRGRYLINFCNTAPLFKFNKMIVVHDLATIFASFSYSLLFRLWYRCALPIWLTGSRDVSTISNFSKEQLEKKFGRRDIALIREGVDHIERLEVSDRIIDAFDLRTRPFVLFVGSLAPHKNLKIIKDIHAKLNCLGVDIVVAGGGSSTIFASHGLDDLAPNVKFVGYVTDEELKGLYLAAHCFIFPSFYEGFGLPPLEAFACGCLVLASNAAAIPEVCGDAALYFDPNDSESLISLFDDINFDDFIRKKRSARIEYSRNFKWSNGAIDVFRILTEK